MPVHAQYSLQFTAGDDVEAASHLSQQPKNPQIGICLNREANGVGNLPEGMLKDAHAFPNGGRGIHV